MHVGDKGLCGVWKERGFGEWTRKKVFFPSVEM